MCAMCAMCASWRESDVGGEIWHWSKSSPSFEGAIVPPLGEEPARHNISTPIVIAMIIVSEPAIDSPAHFLGVITLLQGQISQNIKAAASFLSDQAAIIILMWLMVRQHCCCAKKSFICNPTKWFLWEVGIVMRRRANQSYANIFWSEHSLMKICNLCQSYHSRWLNNAPSPQMSKYINT